MIHGLLIPIAVLLDRILGEPPRFHPLVGFGYLANTIENHLNRNTNRILRGLIGWLICVVPITAAIYYLNHIIGGLWLGILCGWLAIGWKSLRDHGLAVFNALANNQLDDARKKTAYLVSRDTSALEESDLSKATIESVLENTSDAIIAPLFWLLVLGAPGIVFYRLNNTLDAMWGYRNDRFEHFGKVSARIDDALNIIPARITALLFLIFGHRKQAWQAWKTQGTIWYSPNAGVVMASGAGALNLELGGSANYHGTLKPRPSLGSGNTATHHDIKRAINLMDKSVIGFAVIVGLIVTSPLVFDIFGR